MPTKPSDLAISGADVPLIPFIEIDGKRCLWRDILELHKQQLKERQPCPTTCVRRTSVTPMTGLFDR